MTEHELRASVFNRFGEECLFCGWSTDADALVLYRCRHLLGTGQPSDYFPVCPSCREGIKSSRYFEARVEPDGQEHYVALDHYLPA